MPGTRAKWEEIWETGIVFVCIWSTFDLLVFQVILGLSVSGTSLGKPYLSLKTRKIWTKYSAMVRRQKYRGGGEVQERICATCGSFDNNQDSGPNMAILNISLYLGSHCSWSKRH